MATVRLADYRPAPFTIEHTELLFQLHADHAVVEAEFQLVPAGAAADAAPWEFLGNNSSCSRLSSTASRWRQRPIAWRAASWC